MVINMGFFGRMFGSKDPVDVALEDLLSNDEKKRKSASENLVNLGSTAMPALIELVMNVQAESQWEVGQKVIDSLDSRVRQIVTQVIYDLDSGDSQRRKRANEILNKMNSEGRQAVLDLAKLNELASKHETRRKEIINILGQIGNQGSNLETIIPVIVQLLKDRNHVISSSAVDALAKIGRPAVTALAEALKSDDASLRLKASLALKSIEPDAREAIPSLMIALSDSDATVKRNAIAALGNVKGPSKEVISALMDALDKDGSLKDAMKEAFMKIDPFDAELVAQGLDRDSLIVRRLIAEVLRDKGPKAKTALPALFKALKMGDNRGEVSAAIVAIGPEEDAIPYLIDALSDSSWQVHNNITSALAKIGSPALPALVKALRHENKNVREGVAQTLGKIGVGALTAVPDLIVTLSDADSGVRLSAVNALGDIGPGAKEASPVLIGFLRDENSKLREAAVTSLGKIGDAQAVSPILELLFEIPRLSGAPEIEKALLNIAPNSMLTEEIVKNAVKASTYDHIYHGYQYDAGEISLVNSQRAVESLCRIKSQITSNILHLVAKKRNISVTMDTGCSPSWEELVDFQTQRQMALDELAARNSPPYNPEAFIKLPEKEHELIKTQSDVEKSQRESMEFSNLVSQVQDSGEASIKAAKQLASRFKTREAFHVIAVKLSRYRFISPSELYGLSSCLEIIAKEIKQQAIPELTVVMDSWPTAAASVLGSLDIPEVVSPLRRLLEHPNDAAANAAVSALGDYVKRTRDPNAIEALKWAAKRAKPSPDGRVAGRYEWAEHFLKEIGA